MYQLLANLVVVVHLVLIASFLVSLSLSLIGRLHKYPVARWYFWIWIWGKILSYVFLGTCVITILENYFRSQAGLNIYTSGFVMYYSGKLGIILSDTIIFWLITIPTVIAFGSEIYWTNKQRVN
ncbi:MAG: DUF2784 family protein [Patescibacteria group bacterium]